MQATQFEFRYRMVIVAAVVAIGFVAPWTLLGNIGSRIPLLEWLALELSRLGLVSFTSATPAVIVTGSVFALIGAVFRVWGTAWLGPATVMGPRMRAGAVMADGPFRYVRNPLYLGVWFMLAAMTLVMPASGALFVIPVMTVFYLRLIFVEEAFLAPRLGQPYQDYLCAVPRLFPRLRTTLKPTGAKPRWLRAFAAEINPIGVFFILSCLSWSYNNQLLLRAIVVVFGLSLVVRAFLPALSQESSPQ